MRLGIIGKPQSGKTTLFNAAAGAQEQVGDFSQAVHRAVIKVPDSRLAELAAIVNPRKVTPAEIEFLDAPGLTGDAAEARQLEIHPDLRKMDAFLIVVDGFSGSANPERDIRQLTEEMILVDQAMIEGSIERKERKAKLAGDKTEEREIALMRRCLEHLESEQPLYDLELTDDEEKLLRGYMFLSQKPALIVINIAEDKLAAREDVEKQLAPFTAPGKREVTVVCGQIEAELVALDPDARGQFLTDLGIERPAMEMVIRKSYALLGLISFLTAGEPEVRAWTIKRGTTAQKAAGVIHSDIERGFIRAEVTKYDDYIALKTSAALKAAGKLRLEGKEYRVEDGDVILFRFNV